MKTMSVCLSPEQVALLSAGKRTSKCVNGYQVYLSVGKRNSRRQRILAEIEKLRAMLNKKPQVESKQGLVPPRGHRPYHHRRKECNVCGKRVRGMKLHMRLKHVKDLTPNLPRLSPAPAEAVA